MMKKFLIFVFILLILIMPVLSLAQTVLPPMKSYNQGVVPCDNVTVPCDFNAFLDLINNVIRFILFYMAIPIAAIMFAYAGFLLVTAGEEAAGARTKAKSIFSNALIGLVLAAACWLIVKAILFILGYQGAWIGF